MIVNRKEMLEIEQKSKYTSFELMLHVGKKLAESFTKHITKHSKILMLAGKGNNGGDCFAMLRHLQDYDVTLILTDGMPHTAEAKHAYHMIDQKYIQPISVLEKHLHECDVVIDGIFGFGFQGRLDDDTRIMFQRIQSANKPIYSIDINSGAESDSALHDPYALHSTITFVIECYKPFHILYKRHHLFKQTELISLDLTHEIPKTFLEMDENIFFQNFPKRKENAHKASNGKILLVGGSYGMAGAISLNITGAKTLGFPYIEVGLNDGIYPIVASKHTTAVFRPFSSHSLDQQLISSIKTANAISFGSGAACMYEKEACLDLMIQNSHAPLVLDAEAIRLLKYNTYKLRFAKCPIILTPHIGEFSDLFHLEKQEVSKNPLFYALKYAAELKVFIILKDVHTILATPNGHCYINQTGNESLAQAGSGDLLTGMLTALLAYNCDTTTALCMGIWLHGYIADIMIQKHSKLHINLEMYPEIMDHILLQHGY